MTVIDYTSPVELVAGRRTYSKLTLEGNRMVGKIDAWLQTHPGFHNPSTIARGAKLNVNDVYAILSWLDHHEMVVTASGNGNWRKYAAR